MSDSIRDQLLALGLTEDRPRNWKRGGSRQQRRAAKNRVSTGTPNPSAASAEISLDQAYRIRERDEKQRVEAVRKKKMARDRKRREINRKIKTIVDAHRLNRADSELPRNFVHKGRIRKIMVTGEQLASMNAGQLGVVYLSGGYHLLKPEHIESVRQFSAEHVPDLGGGSEEETEHPVPDEITW